MSFKCGIVGLPNVGKSTLFNALTNSNKAQAANFPFCTIDPNIGVVSVPDYRLENLAKISKSKKIIPTTISFVELVCLSTRLLLTDSSIKNISKSTDSTSLKVFCSSSSYIFTMIIIEFHIFVYSLIMFLFSCWNMA